MKLQRYFSQSFMVVRLLGILVLTSIAPLASAQLSGALSGQSVLGAQSSGIANAVGALLSNGGGRGLAMPIPQQGRPQLTDRNGVRTATTGKSDTRSGTYASQNQKLPQHNEFQEFLATSTGRELPLFGADLFANPPSTFAPFEGAPAAPDYVLGAGDEVVIRAWGQVDIDLTLAVDRNGLITIPGVGAIPVAGVRFQELNGLIGAKLAKAYRNFELSVTLGQLAGIQVFVVGQANAPGSYTIGSTSTLVSALFAAGGPSPAGSMRRIQVRRGVQTIVDFDLYAMLLNGDTSRDVRLRNGDVIFIPPIGSLAAVSGSVNVPAIYELKDTNTPVNELLTWAGGPTTLAKVQKVTIEGIRNRATRQVEEVALGTEGSSRLVKDGDVITVHAITPRFDNVITVRGFVAQPSRYPWREGLRVRDLIPDRDALVSPEYWRRRNELLVFKGEKLKREIDSKDDRKDLDNPLPAGAMLTPLQGHRLRTDKEMIEGLSDETIERQSLVPLESPSADRSGILRDPRNYRPRTELRNLEEIAWDYAVIERLQDDLTTTLVPFNLARAILQGDPQHNVLLRPGDILTVFSKADIDVPADRKRRFIRLEGEFASAGIYQALPGETLRQLVVRVGGLTPAAYLFGAEMTRESTRVAAQKQLNESISRLEREAERSANELARNAVVAEDLASLSNRQLSQQNLFAKLKKVRASGRIVLEVPPVASAVKDLPDLPLEDGDRLYVPPRPAVVSVFGAVYNQNTFIHRDTKRVNDYLAQAGGPSRTADNGEIYLLRADGSVISQRQKGWFGGMGGEVVMPGDAIVVPEDFGRTTISKELKDWSQILYQFALGVAGLQVLKNY
jgi:polysaccharide export outer membrane protein